MHPSNRPCICCASGGWICGHLGRCSALPKDIYIYIYIIYLFVVILILIYLGFRVCIYIYMYYNSKCMDSFIDYEPLLWYSFTSQDAVDGGDSSDVQDQLRTVREIVASPGGAFAAILGDGTVVTWGNTRCGGLCDKLDRLKKCAEDLLLRKSFRCNSY